MQLVHYSIPEGIRTMMTLLVPQIWWWCATLMERPQVLNYEEIFLIELIEMSTQAHPLVHFLASSSFLPRSIRFLFSGQISY